MSDPPPTIDRATQTLSPGGQVIRDGLRRTAQGSGGGDGAPRRQHGRAAHRFMGRLQLAAEDMQEETVGQLLREIGDEINRQYELRGEERRRRHDVIFPDGLPPIPQEPMVLLCVSLLLLVIGRIIYLQVSADSEPHSQV